MNSLKEYSNDKLIKLINDNKIGVADFVDSGICPTCFDRENNNILYGNNDDKIIFENDMFECFLVGNPRTHGHVVISTKNILRI